MQKALELHSAGRACVIPILIRPVDWRGAPFAHLQILPTGAKPVSSSFWHSRDEAFLDVAQGIRAVIEKSVEP